MKKLFTLTAILLVVAPFMLLSQDRILKGKIVDDSTGQPIANASVIISGTRTGVHSGGDGLFSIRIPEGDQKEAITVSYIGYITQSIIITHGLGEIRLKREEKALEDVVVIGYGTQKKRNVTGAVSSFDARKLEERPIARVDQALVGQLAGVTVKQTTGIPGKAF